MLSPELDLGGGGLGGSWMWENFENIQFKKKIILKKNNFEIFNFKTLEFLLKL